VRQLKALGTTAFRHRDCSWSTTVCISATAFACVFVPRQRKEPPSAVSRRESHTANQRPWVELFLKS
jgi:hypothetical protein